MSGPRAADAEREARLRILGPVAAVAVAVAARRETDTPPVPAPSSLRPYLRFTRLPSQAVGSVLDILDSDDALRAAVADAVDDLEGLDEGVSDWLRRPEGWEERWSLVLASERDRVADRAERDRERRSGRDRTAAEQALERRNAELEAARAELIELKDLRHALEAKVAGLVHELGHAQDQAERAVEERARAVRELKEKERRLAERTIEVKELRTRLDGGAPEPSVAEPEVGDRPAPDPRWSDVRDIAEALEALRRRLTQVADPAEPAPAHAPVRSPAEAAVPARRRPHRTGRGIAEGSAEEARELLSLAGVVVFVDGYNVTMTGWPRLSAAEQRSALERLVIDGVPRAAEVHLVYDGEAAGAGEAGYTSAGSAVRTFFTPSGREADDEIIDQVGAVDPQRPVVVVSSDARVANGVRRDGANVVASAVFLEALGHRGRRR